MFATLVSFAYTHTNSRRRRCRVQNIPDPDSETPNSRGPSLVISLKRIPAVALSCNLKDGFSRGTKVLLQSGDRCPAFLRGENTCVCVCMFRPKPGKVSFTESSYAELGEKPRTNRSYHLDDVQDKDLKALLAQKVAFWSLAKKGCDGVG